MNSARKGVPSHDPEAEARRKWYADMRALAAVSSSESGEAKSGVASTSKEATTTQWAGGFAMELAKKSEAEAAAKAAAAAAAAAAIVQDSKQSKKTVYERPKDFRPERWLCSLNKPENPPISRLLCFHGIGQTPMFFQSWAKRFESSNIHLCAICLPGRLQRLHEKCASLVEAAAAVSDAVNMFMRGEGVGEGTSWRCPDAPLYLFGHDCGAIIAFEVTKNLSDDMGISVAHLIASSTKPPMMLTASNLDRFETKHSFSSHGDLVRRLQLLLPFPSVFSSGKNQREVLKLLMPTARADYTLYEKYKMPRGDKQTSATSPSLVCPITAVGAAQDRSCSIDDLAAWQAETSEAVFLAHQLNSGGHSFMNVPEKEEILLQYLVDLCSAGGHASFQKEKDIWDE